MVGEKIKVSGLAIKHLPKADLMVLRFCFLFIVLLHIYARANTRIGHVSLSEGHGRFTFLSLLLYKLC
jgi:hypothetical protein